MNAFPGAEKDFVKKTRKWRNSYKNLIVYWRNSFFVAVVYLDNYITKKYKNLHIISPYPEPDDRIPGILTGRSNEKDPTIRER